MKYLLVLLGIVSIIAAGCNDHDRAKLNEKGQKALQGAQDLALSSIDSVSKEISSLSSRSSLADLQSARDKASEILKKAEAIKLDVGPIKDKVLGLRREVDRLDAAIEQQKLRERWNEMLKAANHGKEVTSAQMENLRETLRLKDEAFKALDDKLNNAERAYHNACNRSKQSIDKNKPQ